MKLQTKHWELPKSKVVEFREKRTKYCIGIPVINEGEKIKKQLMRMKKYSKKIDILIFDGGSTDGSMSKSFLKINGVRALLTKLSPGKQGTQLRMGCAYALKQGYEGVVMLDGNNKDDVKGIPSMIKALEEGYDYVQGSRFIKGGYHKNTPFIRLLGIRLLHAPILSLAAGKWYTDTTNGFRALSRKYLLDPRLSPFRDIFVRYEFYFYLTVKANQLGYKTKELPVGRIYPSGKIPTKITGLKGNFDLLLTCFRVWFGYFDPKVVS